LKLGVNAMGKLIFVPIFVIFSCLVFAEVSSYKETSNDGVSKHERLEGVEKHLIKITSAISSLEAKFDENAKKVKSLEDMIKNINQTLGKEKLGEAKSDEASIDLKKMRSDLDTIKSKEIEKIKTEMKDLTDIIKSIQTIMKSQKY
jgi:chromosome segregation ATPase